MKKIKNHIQFVLCCLVACGMSLTTTATYAAMPEEVVQQTEKTLTVTGVAYDAAKFNEEEKAMVETLFTSIGKS